MTLGAGGGHSGGRKPVSPHSSSTVLGTIKITLSGMVLGLFTWKGEDAGTVGVCGWIYGPRIYPYCQGNGTIGLSHTEQEGCTWHLWWPEPTQPSGTPFMCARPPLKANSAFALTLDHAGRPRFQKHPPSSLLFSISALPSPPRPFEGTSPYLHPSIL